MPGRARLCALKAAVLISAAAVFSAVSGPAPAQEVLRIAAVVNDDVISAYDLGRRLRLVLVSIGVPVSETAMRRMAPQVLRLMIDERIKRQEAERLNITPDEETVRAQLARFERQNGVQPGALAEVLENRGASIEPLIEQIEAETTWIRAVSARFGGEVKVGDSEIDAEITAVRAQEGETQHRVAEIFIPHEGGGTESSRQTVSRLLNELNQGADFAALARNFSRAPSAADAGDLGFIRIENLGNELYPAARGLAPGETSGPVETPLGVYLLHMIEKRVSPGLPQKTVRVRLSQYHAALPEDASKSAVAKARKKVQQAVEGVTGCEDFENAAADSESSLSGPLGTLALGDLPGHVRAVVENLPENRPSPPVMTPAGVVSLMVCGREIRGGKEDLRENLKLRIRSQRLADFARQYLRDLKRTALVEIRQ